MKEKGSFSKKSLFVTLVVLFVLALLGGSCNSKQPSSPNDQLTNDSVSAEIQDKESSELTPPTIDPDTTFTEDYDEDIVDETMAIVYSSPIAFLSKESVLSYLSNKTFRHSKYSEIKFDENGLDKGLGDNSSVRILQLSQQSALVQYTSERGNYNCYLIQIDNNKLQVINLMGGCLEYYQEGDEEDYSSYPTIYSSTMSFESKEDVLNFLSGNSFRNNKGLEIVFDENGRAQMENFRSTVLVIQYVSQSAIIKFHGNYSIVQIDGDKIQIVDASDGTVFHKCR